MKDISANDIKNNIPLITRKDYQRKISAKDITITLEKITIAAGPCTIESRSQIMDVAKNIKDCGATMLRGGAFKPLTFPYGEPLGMADEDSDEKSRDRKEILTKDELFQNAEKRLGYMKEAGEKYAYQSYQK